MQIKSNRYFIVSFQSLKVTDSHTVYNEVIIGKSIKSWRAIVFIVETSPFVISDLNKFSCTILCVKLLSETTIVISSVLFTKMPKVGF